MGNIYGISLAIFSCLTAIASIEKHHCPRKQYSMNEMLQIKEGRRFFLSTKWNISYQEVTRFNCKGYQDSNFSSKWFSFFEDWNIPLLTSMEKMFCTHLVVLGDNDSSQWHAGNKGMQFTLLSAVMKFVLPAVTFPMPLFYLRKQ